MLGAQVLMPRGETRFRAVTEPLNGAAQRVAEHGPLFQHRPRRALSGPVRFSPTFPRPSAFREHYARVDSVRSESVVGVKERVTTAFWTAFALSILSCGEREAESA